MRERFLFHGVKCVFRVVKYVFQVVKCVFHGVKQRILAGVSTLSSVCQRVYLRV